jgi:bleomycin hydrolase
MLKYRLQILLCAVALPYFVHAQGVPRDRAVFDTTKNEFLEKISAESRSSGNSAHASGRALKMDFTGVNAPAAPGEFTQYWHNPPVSQGLSGMCWCFSATSYYESEVYRLTKRTVKLSELYTVYWEYVEKARRFVRERGNSEFGEGSESNAVPRIWKKYGIVPEEAYPGLQPGQNFHDHGRLFTEMRDYLQSVRSQNAWNEEQVIGTIRDILNHYLGAPPASVTAGGVTMTPQEYLEKVVHLNLGDYVEFMSLMEKPYYGKTEYPASDNWWHSSDYYNVPLDDFMAIIRKAVRSGHSLCIGGDTSEPGLDGHAGVAVIPSFDIPPALIDENAREFRFTNGTTGDDHGIHIVGYTEKDGKDWYLVKDSGSGSRNNSHPGYYFYREDYVKLKMLDFTVHREVAEDILAKCQKPVK